MEITYRELDEKEAKRIFCDMKCAFRRILNKNKVFDYKHPFNLDDVTTNHLKANEDRSESDFEVYDYYFKIDGKYYALDISHDPNDFGYVNDYYKAKYGPDYQKLFYCELFSFRNFIEYYEARESLAFVYDREQDKIIEVLDINQFGLPLGGSRQIRDVKEENLQRILR